MNLTMGMRKLMIIGFIYLYKTRIRLIRSIKKEKDEMAFQVSIGCSRTGKDLTRVIFAYLLLLALLLEDFTKEIYIRRNRNDF